MANRVRHLAQARHNRRIALHLLDTLPDDPYAAQWAATAAFYCALHCVEAYFADRGVHSLNHENRNTKLADPALAVPADIREVYAQLRQWSQDARYDLRQFAQGRVRTLIVELTLIQVTDWAGLDPI